MSDQVFDQTREVSDLREQLESSDDDLGIARLNLDEARRERNAIRGFGILLIVYGYAVALIGAKLVSKRPVR